MLEISYPGRRARTNCWKKNGKNFPDEAGKSGSVGGEGRLGKRDDLCFVSRLGCHNCVHLIRIARQSNRGRGRERVVGRGWGPMQRYNQVPAIFVEAVTDLA